MNPAGGRIRVVHVITKLAVGGAQESVLVTALGLPTDRYDQFVVAGTETDAEGSLWDDERVARLQVISVDAVARRVSPIRDLRAVLALRRELRRLRPDVVHTHSSKAGIVGRLAARLARVPRVVHSVHGWSFHGELSPASRRLATTIERLAARTTDALVVESSTDLPKGLEHRIGRPRQYALIRNGIDVDRFDVADDVRRATRTDVRRSLGLADDAYLVGTVGRLADQKDPLTMVEAWRVVAEHDRSARFVWIGDGPLRPDVERRIAELGLDRSFLLAGVRDDVDRLLPALDCFSLSSRWEGLPRTLTEAMAAGVPVVVTAVDGSVEAVEPGRNGVLVPSGDPAALGDALVAVRNDPEGRVAMAEAGRRTAERFSHRTMLARLDRLYAGLVAGRGVDPGERRRKVVHVITGLGYGGAERQLQSLVTNGADDFVHEVVSLTDLGPIGADLAARGTPVRALGMRLGRPDPRAVLRLRRHLATSGADVVQTWLYHGDLVGGIVARSLRLPVIWSVRMTWMDPTTTKPATMLVARACARLSRWMPSAIVFNSERGRSTHGDEGYDLRRSTVIGNGIDLDRFRPDIKAPARLRRALGLPATAQVVGMVGRFDPQKGHDVAVAAFASLAPRHPNLQVVLAGPGCDDANRELTAAIRDAGLEGRVSLLGPRHDVESVIAGLDLLVSASRYGESVPNVVLEAVACAVPVVATDVADVADVVAPAGAVVTPGDPDGLAAAIERCLAAAPRRPDATGVALASHGAVARQYVELYEAVTAADGGNLAGDRRRAA